MGADWRRLGRARRRTGRRYDWLAWRRADPKRLGKSLFISGGGEGAETLPHQIEVLRAKYNIVLLMSV